MRLKLDYPREVLELSTEKGRGFRKLVNSKGDFERYWRGKNGVSNAYTTVYGYRATQAPHHRRVNLYTPIIRHFVLDFDAIDFRDRNRGLVEPEEPLEQAIRLHRHLLDQNIRHGVWFSGGGYHIWIALAEILTPSTGSQLSAIKESGMRKVNDWVKEFDLYCCDPAVPFDTSGLIRIPNSFNAKRGFWSIPLSTEDLEKGYLHIVQQAKAHKSGYIEYGTNGITLEIRKVTDKVEIFNPQSEALDLPTVKMNDVIILPCLNQAACQVGGNPSHDARVQLVKYLAKRKRNFLSIEHFSNADLRSHGEEIVDYIMRLQWADQDEGVTRYQVDTIVTKDYPQTCKMLWGKGLCLGKCRYWDKTGSVENGS